MANNTNVNEGGGRPAHVREPNYDETTEAPFRGDTDIHGILFVRSTEPRPSMPGRRVWHRTVAALLCAPGILHAILFCLFAFRARALHGGWPPVFRFYKEMQGRSSPTNSLTQVQQIP